MGVRFYTRTGRHSGVSLPAWLALLLAPIWLLYAAIYAGLLLLLWTAAAAAALIVVCRRWWLQRRAAARTAH